MDFAELEALRRELKVLGDKHAGTLRAFAHPPSNGFSHRSVESKLSIASTSTCVTSLIAAGRWNGDWERRSGELAFNLLDANWTSAGLERNNAFTTAFVLEAVTALESFDDTIRSHPKNKAKIAKAEKILQKAIARGSATVGDYPPSAYVTQLVARTLNKRNKLLPSTIDSIMQWAWDEIAKQLALIMANSKTSDPFQLAYASVLTVSFGRQNSFTPDSARILHAAIEQLFKAQRDDGSWPRSRPLFHYKKSGSAYCYEYEMLIQLLETFRAASLTERLLPFLPRLRAAALALKDTSHKLPDDGLAWSSGHLSQTPGPESWSTASAYHFTFEFQRVIAEAIRRALFSDLDNIYDIPGKPKGSLSLFAPPAGFLDSTISEGPLSWSLRETIYERFLTPIVGEAALVRNGGQFSKLTPMSAILFGPPGTSKTELAKRIAEFLGWPLLSVDPSHVVRNGMDKIQAEADRLFGMLAATEEIVVLLDEFDEMVREREAATDLLSRFLTTAMLPKLAAINKARRIVFLLATNHIENFDLAASRRGRFDMILQVMPPTLSEKERFWPVLAETFTKFHVKKDDKEKVAQLTYDECEALVNRLPSAATEDDVSHTIEESHKKSTLQRPQDPKGTTKWEEVCKKQEEYVRLPARKL